MSRIPKVPKSKYNKDEKFRWVDSQWEKYMTKIKELEDRIRELEEENTNLKKYFNIDYDDKDFSDSDDNQIDLFPLKG